ncbi:MAG: polyprenyl synthetase family protein [Bacteroidales bacterium]
MITLEQARQEVIKTLQSENLRETPSGLYEPIAYTMETGGKRIRPALLVWACALFSDDYQKALYPSLGLEIFHNFTLLHDDVMDRADIRRGQPTVHKKWNENTAILSGDAMLIKAYQYFLHPSAPVPANILQVFNKTALEVCEGQQYDMDFETKQEVSEDAYLKMIELKTSVLIAGALKIGALIGGASEQEAASLYEFGRLMGLAFQLKDDWLDVFGDVEVFGKKIGGDISANKKTYLHIKAKELATLQQQETFEKWQDVDDKPAEKIDEITALYNQLKIGEITQIKIEAFHKQALEALQPLKEQNYPVEELIEFADTLTQRQS